MGGGPALDTIFSVPPGTGLGNRLATLLRDSAIGAALDRPVTIQWTEGRHVRKGGIPYELKSFLDAVQLPSNLNCTATAPHRGKSSSDLNFVEGGALKDASLVPGGTTTHSGWWYPESMFAFWASGWKHAGAIHIPFSGSSIPRPAACNVSEALFLEHFARAQAAVRPRIPLFNSPPRRYLALHVRRGNRHGTLALKNATLQLAASIRSPLPWMLVTEVDAQTRSSYEEQMQASGLTLLRQPPMPPNTSLPHVPGLRDFFALHASCGVLVDATEWGHWVDSSFSSVAALAGGAPILLPQHPKGTEDLNLLWLSGPFKTRIRHVFFADHWMEFVDESRAVCRSAWGDTKR